VKVRGLLVYGPPGIVTHQPWHAVHPIYRSQ